MKGQLKKIIDRWYTTQLPHYGGKYSIERMLALEEYTRNTSIDRVLLVCIGVPLMVIALVLCQESIPLQDPTAGWRVNYGFWVRAGLVGVGVGNAASIQITFWLEIPSVSSKQVLVYCILMGAGYIAAGMVMAELWVFPIPFFMFTLSPVTTSIVLVYLRIFVGAEGLQQILSQREQLRRLNRIGSLQAFMYVVYPAYQVLFREVNHTNFELPVILVLPALRLVIKTVFAAAASHKEDVVPAQVVFTVDFFDAFYLCTFIPTVSTTTLAALMVLDLAQTASELHELDQQTRRIVARLRRAAGITISIDDNLLVTIRSLCGCAGALEKRTFQVRSCIYHQLSDEGRALLERLHTCESTSSSASSYQHNLRTLSRTSSLVTKATGSRGLAMDWFKRCFRRGAVQPAALASAITKSPTSKDIPHDVAPLTVSRKPSAANTSAILQEALEVLFTSECLILSEYLEIIVPVVYGMFVLAMVNFPSAQYHTEMMGITRENVGGMVTKMFTYALLEFGSFVVLACITKRNCGINALYQLAFVLETQMLFVQSTLMMWVLMTLTYRVVHFGADFSFQFQWIQ